MDRVGHFSYHISDFSRNSNDTILLHSNLNSIFDLDLHIFTFAHLNVFNFLLSPPSPSFIASNYNRNALSLDSDNRLFIRFQRQTKNCSTSKLNLKNFSQILHKIETFPFNWSPIIPTANLILIISLS